MASFTLATAKAALGAQLRDITDVPDSTFVQWCSWVAIEAYHFLLGCDASKFIKSQSYTAQTGTQALPADFDTIKFAGCGFFEKNGDGTQSDRRLVETGFGSKERGYYLLGGNVVFTGLDQPISVTVRYTGGFTPYSLLSDYFTVDGLSTGAEIIPLDHLEVLVAGLRYQYSCWDEDIAMEQRDLAKYRDLLNDMANMARREANSYSYPDYSGIY